MSWIVMYFLSLHVQFSTNLVLKNWKENAFVSESIFINKILIDFAIIVLVYISVHCY